MSDKNISRVLLYRFLDVFVKHFIIEKIELFSVEWFSIDDAADEHFGSEFI